MYIYNSYVRKKEGKKLSKVSLYSNSASSDDFEYNFNKKFDKSIRKIQKTTQ